MSDPHFGVSSQQALCCAARRWSGEDLTSIFSGAAILSTLYRTTSGSPFLASLRPGAGYPARLVKEERGRPREAAATSTSSSSGEEARGQGMRRSHHFRPVSFKLTPRPQNRALVRLGGCQWLGRAASRSSLEQTNPDAMDPTAASAGSSAGHGSTFVRTQYTRLPTRPALGRYQGDAGAIWQST